ncbi:hypothetical protein AX774_g8135 [Zancudomyces culisetae]|uniref:Uncharacterized protein n=1 Tax=Zancudomyces culisetae TaxID=1213189 RepID=A0A1R1PC29_ZANCU|nr:hypothetical protein AX774_g8135 [Zancudomyces culisetae]|eukprot:OMH78479.1 hypothetical protein AX774_g8135 [Zancudomyces culisetae]
MHRSERIRTQEGIVDNDKRNSIGQNTAGFTYGTHPVKASGIGSIGKLFAQNKKQKLISEKEMEEIQKKFMTDVGSDKSIKLQSDDVYSRKRSNKLTSFSYRASFDSLQRLKGRNDSNSFFLRVFNKKRDIRHIEELESDDLNLSNFSNFNKNEHHSSDDGYDEKAAKSRFRVSRKVIVWVVFVLVVMVVVAGYILWPRNPLILLQGLETTDIPNILFDYENSNYAVSVSVIFSVVGVSYNFYPQTLKKITTNISLQSTGTALGTHTENNVVLNGQESSTVKINTWLSYKTSDIADSTIVEMFNKCGYVNPLVYRNNSSEQGYLDLAVQTDVQAKSLIFTTHQKVVGQFKVQCHS